MKASDVGMREEEALVAKERQFMKERGNKDQDGVERSEGEEKRILFILSSLAVLPC